MTSLSISTCFICLLFSSVVVAQEVASTETAESAIKSAETKDQEAQLAKASAKMKAEQEFRSRQLALEKAQEAVGKAKDAEEAAPNDPKLDEELLARQAELRAAEKAMVDANSTKVAAANVGGTATVFDQFKFGVGIGVSRFSKDEVLETQIEEGLVRITDAQSTRRGLWLETHYLLDRFAPFDYFSFGPFFGIQLLNGGDEAINGIGFGIMASLKRKKKSDPDKAAFNIGIGYHSTKIKVLGNGITEDQALPMGVESVRLRTKDESGILFMFSVSVF